MATTSERGLGAYHVADKERLKAAMQDGEPCWRCGQPMYHWQDLDRDHVIDRAHGGTDGPAVLAHASCNRAAGARAGNLGRRYTISVATAPPATCKACGRQYRYAARTCEICGAHYHPSYGEQRTCGRVCGMELHRRNRLAKPPKQQPSCARCGRPCNRKYCSQECATAARSDAKQHWPSSRLQHYTCRYCGKPGVTHGTRGQLREVCPAKQCQLARRAANNLRVRKGFTQEAADEQMRAIVMACQPAAYGRWQSRW